MLPSYVFIYKHREKVPYFIISQLLKYFVLEFRHLHISFLSKSHSFFLKEHKWNRWNQKWNRQKFPLFEWVSDDLSVANGCLCFFLNKWQVSDTPVLRYIIDELCIKSYLHFNLIGQRYPKDSQWNLTCIYIYFENGSSYIRFGQSDNVHCIKRI